jgi:hypothetical protein
MNKLADNILAIIFLATWFLGLALANPGWEKAFAFFPPYAQYLLAKWYIIL